MITVCVSVRVKMAGLHTVCLDGFFFFNQQTVGPCRCSDKISHPNMGWLSLTIGDCSTFKLIKAAHHFCLSRLSRYSKDRQQANG